MILQKIMAHRSETIKEEMKQYPLDSLKKSLSVKEVLRNNSIKTLESLFEDGNVFLGEIKFASPSKGNLSQLLDFEEVAKSYVENEVSGISVLTEPFFFKGNIDYLKDLRETYPKTFLFQKDFIFCEYQIYLAKFLGANAILLIVDALSENELKRLMCLADEINLSYLLEVHSKKSLDLAHNLGAKVIGINNRNLKTMKVSLKHSFEMSEYFLRDRLYISESGLSQPSEVIALQNVGFQGFLIGTSLMETENPGLALKNLRSLCK